MPPDVDDPLAAGRAALAGGQWAKARDVFEAALARHENPEALAGLADALWWLGETEAAITYGQRAYAIFRRRPDPLQAAYAAIGLYFLYRISLGNTVAARGWLGRLARLVEYFELAQLAGWVLLVQAHDSDDPAAAEGWARRAGELAREGNDADLELCALSQLGASLVQQGRLAEGAALLDESMAASLAGECRRLSTVVFTSCNMISSCAQTAEISRATQWIRAADGFTRRYGSPHLYTHCRTYHGAVLFAAGDWAGAERELRAALRAGSSAERALHGEAVARLAELRLAQGRIEEAERFLDGFEDDDSSAVVLAALRLADGEPATAARIVRRRLRELDERDRTRLRAYRAGASACLEEAALLELLGAAEIEQGSVAAATAAAKRLAASAAAGYDLITARGERALGRALGASGDPGAVPHLERALAQFGRLEMPYEVASTRLLLARLSVGTDRETAIDQAQLALAELDALGAARDADTAAALLRSLGVSVARGGSGHTGVLTNREREVLRLLGEGLSNRELAERMFLSRKTVEHHVRGVLTKLGLRSRAQAAAYAVRHSASDSATG